MWFAAREDPGSTHWADCWTSHPGCAYKARVRDGRAEDGREWNCAACGAVTRARMADRPAGDAELRQQVDQALRDSTDSCARCKTCRNQADAVMDVIAAQLGARDAAAMSETLRGRIAHALAARFRLEYQDPEAQRNLPDDADHSATVWFTADDGHRSFRSLSYGEIADALIEAGLAADGAAVRRADKAEAKLAGIRAWADEVGAPAVLAILDGTRWPGDG